MSCYIGQSWQEGQDEELISKDPLETEVIWQGKSASIEQASESLGIAKEAFKSWSKTSFKHRASILKNYAELLKKNHEQLAQCISKEMGKPFWESKTEVQAMISKVDLSIKAHLERCRQFSQSIGEALSITRYHPIGVCLVIGPFNLPAHLPNGHIVPALLAGNTVVFKPSEKTPAVGELMVKYLTEAGLPCGVLQLLQGGLELSKYCVESSLVDIIAFTGSYKAGAQIHRACGGHPEKMLALEMGGNNPLIIWDPSDTSLAAYHTILSTFITSGQRCVCARRLMIPKGHVGDEIINELKRMMKGIQIKTWNESPEGFMGPLVDHQAGQHVLMAEKKSLANGAQAHIHCEVINGSNAFLSPGLLEWESHTTFKQKMGDEEVFGPLLNVFRCESFDEALSYANDTNYGLAAGLISKEESLWNEFRTHIRAGITNWNRQITGAVSSAPFGGIGHSGNYRPSAYHAADYCSYPSASIEVHELPKPDKLMTGMEFEL